MRIIEQQDNKGNPETFYIIDDEREWFDYLKEKFVDSGTKSEWEQEDDEKPDDERMNLTLEDYIISQEQGEFIVEHNYRGLGNCLLSIADYPYWIRLNLRNHHTEIDI